MKPEELDFKEPIAFGGDTSEMPVDEEESKNELTLSTPMEILEEKILSENDQNELKNIINVFNLNIKKKEIVRNKTISDLQDKALNQMAERLEKKAGEFSNKDLLDFYKVLKDTGSSNANIDSMPTIQINQQNLNIGTEELDRTSREKVAEAVRAILNKYSGSDLTNDENNGTI